MLTVSPVICCSTTCRYTSQFLKSPPVFNWRPEVRTTYFRKRGKLTKNTHLGIYPRLSFFLHSQNFIYIKITMASLTFKRKAEAIPFNVYQTKESALLHSLIAGVHDFPGESSWLLKGFIWKKIILASVPLAIRIFEKKQSASFDQLWFTEYSLKTWSTEDNTSLWIQPKYYGVWCDFFSSLLCFYCV